MTADATVRLGDFRRKCCLLFLVAAVEAFASLRANQGSIRVTNALPSNIIIVTNTNDSGPGSLRQALADANDGDSIDATGVSGTILLTSGELQITHNVTINGPGAGTLAIDGSGSSRVFENFVSHSVVTISGFTITNGLDNDGRGGGAVLNGSPFATLTVSNCTVSGNSAEFGGGISNGNLAWGAGLIVSNSTISGNSGDYGGGILNSGGLTVSNSTISGNSANYGGGISNVYNGRIVAGVTISNSTLSGNLSGVDGGGVYNSSAQGVFAVLSIENSTIAGNSATGHGGAIYNNSHGFAFTPGLALGSTILNAGESGGTIFNDGGEVTSLGYNLASDAGGGVLTGPGDQINTDPTLGPLQDNGGPTFTHELLPGSPAINAGDPSFTPPPFFDQRGLGFDRVGNGRIDIGSFEVQSHGPIPTPTATPTPTPTPTATPRVTPRPSPTPRLRPTPAPRPLGNSREGK
jgi:hypothetical protein